MAMQRLSLVVLTIAQTLGAAFLLARKGRRFLRRRDSYEWSKERWSGVWIVSPSPDWKAKNGPHLTFYADGFAETRLAVQLGRALSQIQPQWRFSLTIRNLQDADAGHAIPADWPVCALPFDYFPAVQRWFSKSRPDGVIMIEKLFYPNIVRGCSALGARVVGVNSYARASDCRKNPVFKRWIVGGFAAIGFRSAQQQLLLQPLLGAVKWEITGSLKFPAPRTSASVPANSELARWLDLAGARPCLAAGSVEAGEIEVLCDAFALLRQNCEAVLVWAPRHVETAGQLKTQLEARGWKVARRSEFAASGNLEGQNQTAPDAPFDVLLLDTMGELVEVYRRCEGAFVGGTFAGGGHNVLEPLGYGIPVVFGPKRGFFAAEQQLCEENDVGIAVADAQALGQIWQTMLEDSVFREQVRARIAVFIKEGQKSWQATLNFLMAQCEEF